MFWKKCNLKKISYIEKSINNNELNFCFDKHYKLDQIIIDFQNNENEEMIKHFILINNKDNSEIYKNIYTDIIHQRIIFEFNKNVETDNIKIIYNDISKLKLNFYFFTRKHSSLLISARKDAFGSRMIALVSAIYLAKINKINFGFTWDKSSEHMLHIANECELFDKKFLDKHLYTTSLKNPDVTNIPSFKNTNDLFKCHTFFGHYVMNYYLLNNSHIADLDTKDYISKFGKIFRNIPFSKHYKEIIHLADNFSKKLSTNSKFIAIHMRAGGDILGDIHYRRNIFNVIYNVFPVDIVIYTINYFLEQNFKIALFSPDKTTLVEIKKYFYENSNQIVLPTENFNLTEMETQIFEIIVMSHAEKIISSQSAYAKFASAIGNNKIINFNALFTSEELLKCMFIHKYEKINLSSVQKVASCAYGYVLAKKLNLNLESKISFLNKALEFDINNQGFRIILLKEFLAHDQIQRAEKFLEIIFIQYYENFFSTLFSTLFKGKVIAYKDVFNIIIEKTNCKHPYLCFTVAKIYNHCGNTQKAKKYLKYCLLKDKDNSFFLELAKELNIQYLIYNIDDFKTAKERIQNHLAYKLGNALIENSKSVFGYIRMPFVLSYIRDKHKLEQKKYEENIKKHPELILPPLEDYPDYKEALKEKECFTYKLGLALMRADKNWYGGGVYQIFTQRCA